MIISYAQNFEDVMLWRVLQHVTPGFYIDVGANDPSVDSVTRLFYEKGWRGINVEPLAFHCMDLQRARPRDINLQCAAGNTVGTLAIWECGVRGWATAEESVVRQHVAQGRTGKYSQVPVNTLTSICEQYAPQAIHFLKIDVEGFERAVLEGMDFTRFRPWVVVVEATRPNTTQEVHGEWDVLLTGQSYAFVYGDGLNRFYLADEHSDLSAGFTYSPNFFDDFVSASRAEAEARAIASENCLDEALARATQAEAHLQKIYRSTSWRLTAPLRALTNAKNRWGHWSMWKPKAVLLRLVGYLSARPALRLWVGRLVMSFPVLGERMKTLVRAVQGRPHDPLAHLPSRIRGIYASLKTMAAARPVGSTEVVPVEGGQRCRLAYVSPLPPARTGIADYSADLILALKQLYDVEVIVLQADSESSAASLAGPERVRSVQWFLENVHHYDRVLYHFGNSHYHQRMFQMLERAPGVVVLHDFYLSGVLDCMEQSGTYPFALGRALYASHGYAALAERFADQGVSKVVGKYPTNWAVLQQATGVVVHSHYARTLADAWYGANAAQNWDVIPLLRAPVSATGRQMARQALGLANDELMVCSFGVMGANKLNHRLLQAWLDSRLAIEEKCSLVFVGEAHAGDYGQRMTRAIQASAFGSRIRILGWTDTTLFSTYLFAADVAVQLRSNSRGESSAAVLDCMNHGVATITNAHGSFADLPHDAVWMLPDVFDNCNLTDALNALGSNADSRMALGARGRAWVNGVHSPSHCALGYEQAIEAAYARTARRNDAMRTLLSQTAGGPLTDQQALEMALTLAQTLPRSASAKQWLIDVSGTCRSDPKTGIQRVVRALVWEWIRNPPAGCRVEPVYLSDEGGQWHYRYARAWMSESLGCPSGCLSDEPVEFFANDVLLIADFISAYAAHAERAGVYTSAKRFGTKIYFVVYDLLPLSMPDYFPPNQFGYVQWLDALSRVADGAMCISQSVAHDLRAWLQGSGPRRDKPLQVDWFHLGADIQQSIPTTGVQSNAQEVLEKLRLAPSFLMVGTLEPRKGYLQTIAAFSWLWQQGHHVNLVIVGAEGWKGYADSMRRTIPRIMERLRNHPELGKQLIWLDGISDEYLEKIYATSTCLIAASEGEGFGLPLIEAAQHRMPILARNIPVFQEVAGPHAMYFEGMAPEQLAHAVLRWMDMRTGNQVPDSSTMPWLTWEQSASTVVQKLHAMNTKDTHAAGI